MGEGPQCVLARVVIEFCLAGIAYKLTLLR